MKFGLLIIVLSLSLSCVKKSATAPSCTSEPCESNCFAGGTGYNALPSDPSLINVIQSSGCTQACPISGSVSVDFKVTNAQAGFTWRAQSTIPGVFTFEPDSGPADTAGPFHLVAKAGAGNGAGGLFVVSIFNPQGNIRNSCSIGGFKK